LTVIEDIGTALYDVIEWAQATGAKALKQLAKATVRVKNSVAYLLNYMENDLLPGLSKIMEGLLEAGYALSDLISWAAQRTVEVVVELVNGALAVGTTLAQLITETIAHPEKALENLVSAFKQVGKTMAEIFQAVIVDTAKQFINEVVQALVAIGEGVVDILKGVLEISGGAIGTVIAILFELLGSYRPLSDEERADARVVFGDSINLDEVYIAKEGAFNSIIFGVQDFFSQLSNGNFANLTDETDSRAFVTGNLINFDTDERFDRPTFIHELTHVWQNQNVGPVYLSHALVAQASEGYNYGYNESSPTVTLNNAYYDGVSETYYRGYIFGEGGTDELNAADGKFDKFNPEQQAQITMQYFARRVLDNQTPEQYEAWQQYIDVVQAGVLV
jgi:hypothetical protein